MKYTVTLYIANRRVNDFMAGFDLRDPGKWYYDSQVITIDTVTKVDKAYFQNMIQESKKLKDFWIPAIRCMGNFVVDPDVRQLSDGATTMFIPPMQNA